PSSAISDGLLTNAAQQVVVLIRPASAVFVPAFAQTTTIAAYATPEGDEQCDRDARIERTPDDMVSRSSRPFMRDEVDEGASAPIAGRRACDACFSDSGWLADFSERDAVPLDVQTEEFAPSGNLPLDMAALAFVLIGSCGTARESDNRVRRR